MLIMCMCLCAEECERVPGDADVGRAVGRGAHLRAQRHCQNLPQTSGAARSTGLYQGACEF